MSAENSADTGPGAAVCASGSQPWKGTKPGLGGESRDQQRERDHVRSCWVPCASASCSCAKFSAPWLGVEQRCADEDDRSWRGWSARAP